MLTALTAAVLSSCGLFQPPAPTSTPEVTALSVSMGVADQLVRGITAGGTINVSSPLTLTAGASFHANAGYMLNQSVSLNGSSLTSTSTANTCTDNTRSGWCVAGKPKNQVVPLSITAPNIAEIRTKNTPSSYAKTLNSSVNINSSNDWITFKAIAITILVKGSLTINQAVTLENTVIVSTETVTFNQGVILRNSSIIAKTVNLNGTSNITNSRIISNEDLQINGALSSAGSSTVVTDKTLQVNQNLTASSGATDQLALLSGTNLVMNSSTSSSGNALLWAGGNITLNRNLNLNGGVLAKGNIVLNQGLSLAKAAIINTDLSSGVVLTRGPRYTGVVTKTQPFTTPDGLVMRAGRYPDEFGDKTVQVFGQRILPEDLISVKLGGNVFDYQGWTDLRALYALGAVNESSDDFTYELPMPEGMTIAEVVILAVSDTRSIVPSPIYPERRFYWKQIVSVKQNTQGKIEFSLSDSYAPRTFAIYRIPTQRNVIPQNGGVLQMQQQQANDFAVTCRINGFCDATSVTRINSALNSAYDNLQTEMGIAPRFVQAFFSVDQVNGRSDDCFERQWNRQLGQYEFTANPPTPNATWAYYDGETREIH